MSFQVGESAVYRHVDGTKLDCIITMVNLHAITEEGQEFHANSGWFDSVKPTTDELIQRLESAGFAKLQGCNWSCWEIDFLSGDESTDLSVWLDAEVSIGDLYIPCNNFTDAVKLALTLVEVCKK